MSSSSAVIFSGSGFVENEMRAEVAQPAGASAFATQTTPTIPAGNTTITLPGAGNFGGRNGSDVGV